MDTVYLLTLSVHNLLRWIVLLVGIVVTVRAWLGWLGKKEWTARDRKLGAFFGITFDVQLLLGLLLYFVVSPLMTETILPNFGAAMQNGALRFFAIEHIVMGILALVFAHLGSVLAKRAKDSTAKYRTAAIWFTLALLVLLAAIPWSRPLLRLG
ncbi:MAG: hypothetical protein ACOYYS_26960 [Chloroflexota bacterium]